MTAVQAGDMRFLGGYVGAMFMGAAKVLGEEGIGGVKELGEEVRREKGKGKDGDEEGDGEEGEGE